MQLQLLLLVLLLQEQELLLLLRLLLGLLLLLLLLQREELRDGRDGDRGRRRSAVAIDIAIGRGGRGRVIETALIGARHGRAVLRFATGQGLLELLGDAGEERVAQQSERVRSLFGVAAGR